MNVLDLFSGIGGFSLGLERAGMHTVAFCEIDLYCQRVLMRHWPAVPVFGDIRNLTAKVLADAGCQLRDQVRAESKSDKFISNIYDQRCGTGIDLICGGFPCQDISVAGKGEGITGQRSGLWSEFARIIGEVRPRYVIVENVAALLGRGIERVLGDLAALGYDAEWHCISAAAVGAPHRRDRVWIIAYARGEQHEGDCSSDEWSQTAQFPEANADSSGLSLSWPQPVGTYWRQAGGMFASTDWWSIEPDVGRVAHGVPFRVDRLRALGNSIVPQIAEIIGKAIMQWNRPG